MNVRHPGDPRRPGAILLLAAVLAACEASTTGTPALPASDGPATVAPVGTTAPALAPGELPPLGDVPMYKASLDRNGVQPGPGPVAEPVEAWSHALGCMIGDRTPALADGLLIVGCDASLLRAVDARTGEERWT